MSAAYYTDDSVVLHHGDAAEVLRAMPYQSVDCIVTSPPYWGQRDYGVNGQVGSEVTPDHYVMALGAIFQEAWRVLSDDGTLWLNIGDKYLDKRLLLLPARVAIALSANGWVLRNENIWAKRNMKPEAVTDRLTHAHEQVYFFTKKPRGYFYDADAIREESDPTQTAHNERYAREYAAHTANAIDRQPGNVNDVGIHSRPGKPGRNARSVWSISAQPFPEAHFAVMPPKMAEKCVLAGCKPGGTVLDPFSGSGTTGMVALRHGRKYVGVDLSAEALDLSLRTRLLPTLPTGAAS